MSSMIHSARPLVISQSSFASSGRIDAWWAAAVSGERKENVLQGGRGLSDLRAEFRERPDAADATFDETLPRAFAVVGQPELDARRLAAADRLRVVCNVEGNFLPNVDYAAALARGIHVLSCGPAYAAPVAELRRSATGEDRIARVIRRAEWQSR